ncbi:MAG TPA: hypothetical protein VFT29_14665 [Gemmatimonadaceae bacterium]|nr:hypothetical protein [Gemmatimonadaceae bacterium]
MEWMKVFGLLLQVSIALIVVALAMQATWSDVMFMFRQPALLLKSLIARNLVMPLVAILLMFVFPLEPPVRVALAALSLTPVPPFLPGMQLRAGGRQSYTIGLLASHTLLAVVLVPLSLAVMELIFGARLRFTPANMLTTVARIFVPFAIGMLLRRSLRTSISNRLRAAVQLTSMILLAVGLVGILVLAWREVFTLVGNGTLVAFVLFSAIGLLAGHLLGGPLEEDRTALALATPARHPGVAIAVAAANFPAYAQLAGAAVVLYLLVEFIVARPYIARRESLLEPDTLSRSGIDRRHGSRAAADRRRVVG